MSKVIRFEYKKRGIPDPGEYLVAIQDSGQVTRVAFLELDENKGPWVTTSWPELEAYPAVPGSSTCSESTGLIG